MGRFIEGADRTQVTLLPEAIDDYVGEDNPVRVVDAFVVRSLGCWENTLRKKLFPKHAIQAE